MKMASDSDAVAAEVRFGQTNERQINTSTLYTNFYPLSMKKRV